MSECVVRMEIPKNCYVCDMRGSWAFCPIGKWPLVGYKKQRHEDCPIICQLPEGHGRLVDADALLEQHKPSIFTKVTDFTEGQRSVVANIKNAPTIVQAERREICLD